MINKVYNNRVLIFVCLYIANILLFWPGLPNDDAINQYIQAKAGSYNDHHPAMMSVMWYYLNYLHDGYGLIYLIQTNLL